MHTSHLSALVFATALLAGCGASAESVDGTEAASSASSSARKPFAHGEGSAAIAEALVGSFTGEPARDADGSIFASLVLDAKGTFTATAGVPAQFYPNERNDERGRWGIEAFTVHVATGDVVRHSLVLNTVEHGVLSYDFNDEPTADGATFVLNDQPVQQTFARKP